MRKMIILGASSIILIACNNRPTNQDCKMAVSRQISTESKGHIKLYEFSVISKRLIDTPSLTYEVDYSAIIEFTKGTWKSYRPTFNEFENYGNCSDYPPFTFMQEDYDYIEKPFKQYMIGEKVGVSNKIILTKEGRFWRPSVLSQLREKS